MHNNVETIEREIAEFEKQQGECLGRIRALRDEENPAKGVFRHQEIHAAQQEKLRLDFEIQFRRNKVNRLRFGG